MGRAIAGDTKLAIECSLVLAGVARESLDPVTDLHAGRVREIILQRAGVG